ncbi:toxin RelE [Salinicoccus sediminis]|uniref:Toxin RelE n=1 Tax=Salinicoccus sediminis TaxID=1432562 RepID=A0A0M2SMV3_9STAP|nr:hypothetical protein [Salinicoccus sediminis]KKK33930.1 toxin RelE [Salinicoccus sediminis]
MHDIIFNKFSQREYDNLDVSQKVFVTKGLKRIEEKGMGAGQPLRGELAHCRKLKNNRSGLRIVFVEVEGKIEVIEIIAIGKRSDKEVYKDAIKRLRD